MNIESALTTKYRSLFDHLDERQRRLVAAADATQLGRGGVSTVARCAGLSRPTIHKGLQELGRAPLSAGRIRRPGAGRRPLLVVNPAIRVELERLIDPATRGDPKSPLRWTSKSTRHLAEVLTKAGHSVSHETLAKLLHELEYSLQAATKTVEGTQHPDRNAQFEYISRLTKRYLRNGWPVISVDTKKKELVGRYHQAGREWRPQGQPEKVFVHDSPDPNVTRAVPYGVYDVGQDLGWVNVGTDHDTASFAVESIRRWWRSMGAPLYPAADRLLICADAGGSDGHRSRLWKVEVQRFASDAAIEVTVCHFPPGTSKWNTIDHRLFSRITMNWRGRPLVSHDVIVNLIGATKTASGLRVKARLDKRRCPLGMEVSDEALGAVKLLRHRFHGDWNYSIRP